MLQIATIPATKSRTTEYSHPDCGSLTSALLFGVGHSAQGIIGVVDNVFLGLFISGLYLISGRNLWLPILTHGVIDTIGLSMLHKGILP